MRSNRGLIHWFSKYLQNVYCVMSFSDSMVNRHVRSLILWNLYSRSGAQRNRWVNVSVCEVVYKKERCDRVESNCLGTGCCGPLSRFLAATSCPFPKRPRFANEAGILCHREQLGCVPLTVCSGQPVMAGCAWRGAHCSSLPGSVVARGTCIPSGFVEASGYMQSTNITCHFWGFSFSFPRIRRCLILQRQSKTDLFTEVLWFTETARSLIAF